MRIHVRMRAVAGAIAMMGVASCLCPTAWADDEKATTCHDRDLKPSISADDSSGRVLMSEEPGTLRIQPYSSRGDYVVIKLADGMPNGTPVHVTETDRDTRISSELSVVLPEVVNASEKKDKNNAFAPSKESTPTPPEHTFPCVRYLQQLRRSTITVDFPPAAALAGLSAGAGQARPAPAQKSFIAGPPEHLYLSADLPINKAKQLTYDAQKNTVVETTVPQTFYLALNLKVGDVYTRAGDAPFYDNLSFKLLGQLTAPTDSYGYGLGYDLGPATLFVARLYTRNAPTISSPTSGTTLSTVFGVSFNIENGIKWLSGK